MRAICCRLRRFKRHESMRHKWSFKHLCAGLSKASFAPILDMLGSADGIWSNMRLYLRTIPCAPPAMIEATFRRMLGKARPAGETK
jgi:hypothetical protein